MTHKISLYSTTAASNNSAVPDGWPEGMLPSAVNNCARENMARLREWYQDAEWIDHGHTIVSSTASTIVVSGDHTAIYLANRAIKVNQSAAQDGWITSSTYSAPNTTINITGFTVSSPTGVEVGIISSSASFPNKITTSMTFDTVTVGVLLNSSGTHLTNPALIDVKTSGSSAAWSWPVGAVAVKITIVGGGGGGSGGGTAANAGNGSNATDSSAVYNGITYTGGGGVGGTFTTTTGGSGGSATNGNLNCGGGSAMRSTGGGYEGGTGGSSTLGGAGKGSQAGKLYGGGGGGGNDTGTSAGAGGGGGGTCIVRIAKVPGLETITYSVGGGGAGGTAGGSGGVGGAGAGGVVIFEY